MAEEVEEVRGQRGSEGEDERQAAVKGRAEERQDGVANGGGG